LKREWQKTKKHLREDTVDVSALKSEPEYQSISHYLYADPYDAKVPKEIA
jgi:hypothetical protein